MIMKKNYLKPDTQVITMNICHLICESTTTPIADENETPPGGWGPANARSYSVWGEEDEQDVQNVWDSWDE